MARDSKREFKLIITARNMTRRVMRSVRDGIRSIGKVSGMAAGVAVAAFATVTAAIAGVVSKILDLNDGLAKQARRFKMTTEELSGLRHAAAMGGIEVKEIDTAIQYMERNASDAANGIGEAKDAFEGLGIEAEELRKMNPADAFELIIDRLQGVDNAFDRSSYAMDIFGRSGARVLTLTADGIRDARKEARQFNIAIGEADASKMERINDDLHKIKMALRGFATVFTTGLIGPIETFTDKVSEAAKSGELKKWALETAGFVRDVAVLIAQGIPQALNLVLLGAEKVALIFSGWKLLWTELRYQFANFMEVIWTGLHKAREGLTAFLETFNVGGIFDDAIAESRRISQEQEVILDSIAEKKRQALTDQREAIKKQKEQSQAVKEYEDKIARVEKKVEGLVAALEGPADRQRQLIEGSKGLGSATKEGVDQAVAEINRLADAYVRLAREQGKFMDRAAAVREISSGDVDLERLDKAVALAERT